MNHIKCAIIPYYNDPEALTKAFIEDGHYRTGDLIQVEYYSFFYLIRKKTDKVSASHIYPSEIERVLQIDPKISNCDTIGVFSRQVSTNLSEVYITLVDEKDYKNKDVIARDISEFANKQLHELKQTRANVVVKKVLERTPGGKIQYSVLKEEALMEQDNY